MSTATNRRTIIVLAAAAALLTAAFAAAPQAEASSLFACVKKTGAARIFSKKPKCKKGETKLSWNSQGATGKNGINGINGVNGVNGVGKEGAPGKDGTNGTEGPPGQPQKAVTFSATLAASFEAPPSAPLFNLGGVSAQLVCFNFIGNFSFVEAAASAGFAQTGMAVSDSATKSPEVAQEPVREATLGSSFTQIIKLSSNIKEPLANIAHVNGSIMTPTSVVLWDAFLRTGANPAGCTIRGTALTVPL